MHDLESFATRSVQHQLLASPLQLAQDARKICLATLVCSGLQLGNVHLDHEAADMNVSAVALAAVDIAATALDSALLTVERTVERSQQRPEVSNSRRTDCACLGCLLWRSHFTCVDTLYVGLPGGTVRQSVSATCQCQCDSVSVTSPLILH